jgi:hypothetical protein
MANRGVSDEINPNKAPPTKLTAVRKPTVASAVSIVFVRGFFGRYRQPIPGEKTGANAVIPADLSMSGGRKLQRTAFLSALQMAASTLRNQGKKVNGHVEYLTQRKGLAVVDRGEALPGRSRRLGDAYRPIHQRHDMRIVA